MLPESVVTPELQVQAGLHDIDVGSDIDWKRRHRPDWTECAAAQAHAVIIADTVVVVFNEAGEPVEERIFTADTNSPAAARLA